MNKALEFRTQQRGRLHSGCESAGCSHSVASAKKTTLGDVTSLNLTMLRAGVRAGDIDVVNVVPPIGKHLRSCILSLCTHHLVRAHNFRSFMILAEAAFDIRITPNMETSDIANMFTQWCQEVQQSTPGLPADGGLQWSFMNNALHEHKVTSTDPTVNPWYGVFTSAITRYTGADIRPEIFPAGIYFTLSYFFFLFCIY